MLTPLPGTLNAFGKSVPGKKHKTMQTIRNNKDLVELATYRNEVMFGNRISEYMKNNEKLPKIIFSGNKTSQI